MLAMLWIKEEKSGFNSRNYPGDSLTANHQGKKSKFQRWCEIIIADNGCGIEENIHEKVFDPFFTTKNSDSGSGFGLYNCKLFVEDHKGIIGYYKSWQGHDFLLCLFRSSRKPDS